MIDGDRDELKAIFARMVEHFGGAVACGARLGISHQRICALGSPDYPKDVPNLLLHILPLEGWRKQAVVTGYYSSKVAAGPLGDLMTDAMEATESVAALQRAIRRGGDRKAQLSTALEAQAEIADVIANLQRTD